MRIGVDLGGSKIEIVALDDGATIVLRERTETPKRDYDATVRAIAGLVAAADAQLGEHASVGLAIPGTISPKTGLVKNANSTCLIGHPLDKDVEAAIGRPVRVANDANCFALSEATDGAGRGAAVVFGVILGTGVGGGLCVGGRVLTGAHAIAGEWGHNPLPAPRADELPGPECYCAKTGCIETWLSGPALESQYQARTGKPLTAAEIAATGGDVLERYLDRLARALAGIVNVVDPDVIVLGGGLSNIEALYGELPPRVEARAFAPEGPTLIVRNVHGDSSGVRGAAWLWPKDGAR
jgi:fructokinase